MKLGVFTPVFGTMKLDEVLVKVRALRHVRALEIGTGGWPGNDHLDVDALLDRKPCADEYRKKIADAGLTISALSCHNNPLHTDAATAKAADDLLRKTVRLAEQLDVPVVVTFSGCPGDSEGAMHPNWVTTPWPPEFLDIPRLAVGEEDDSVLDPHRALRRRTWRQGRARGAPRVHRLQRRQRAAAAPGRGTEPRRQLRSEPLLLAGGRRAGGDPRAR